MKYIAGPRQTGKTTKIIKEVKAHNGILLVHSFMEQQRLERLHPDLRDKIFTWEQLKPKIADTRNPIFVDNADMWLQQLCDYRIEGITIGGL